MVGAIWKRKSRMSQERTIVFTDTPRVVELKAEFRSIDAREELLKDDLAAAEDEEKKLEIQSVINAGRLRKEEIAREIALGKTAE
jgi:hypothetical protein